MAAQNTINVNNARIGCHDLADHTSITSQCEPPRAVYMRVPPPPRYPPPPSQNSPAFFPLSCVVAPEIEPEDLHFALDEMLAEQEDSDSSDSEEDSDHGSSVLGVAEQNEVEVEDQPTDADADSDKTGVLPTSPVQDYSQVTKDEEEYQFVGSDYDSDSSEEDSMGCWYASRNYAAEREGETRWGPFARRLDSVLDYVWVQEGPDSECETSDEDEDEDDSGDADNHLQWLREDGTNSVVH